MPVVDHFRAFARRPTSLPIQAISDGLGWELAAELVDLGLGGASIITREPLPFGMTLKLRINAPELWEPLLIAGRVVWSRVKPDGKCQLGVKFDLDSAGVLAILAELVGPGSRI